MIPFYYDYDVLSNIEFQIKKHQPVGFYENKNVFVYGVPVFTRYRYDNKYITMIENKQNGKICVIVNGDYYKDLKQNEIKERVEILKEMIACGNIKTYNLYGRDSIRVFEKMSYLNELQGCHEKCDIERRACRETHLNLDFLPYKKTLNLVGQRYTITYKLKIPKQENTFEISKTSEYRNDKHINTKYQLLGNMSPYRDEYFYFRKHQAINKARKSHGRNRLMVPTYQEMLQNLFDIIDQKYKSGNESR